MKKLNTYILSLLYAAVFYTAPLTACDTCNGISLDMRYETFSQQFDQLTFLIDQGLEEEANAVYLSLEDNYNQIIKLYEAGSLDACKENCTSATTTLSCSCAFLPHPMCVSACIWAVEILRRQCVNCCETGNSWKYCYKPIINYTIPVCNLIPSETN